MIFILLITQFFLADAIGFVPTITSQDHFTNAGTTFAFSIPENYATHYNATLVISAVTSDAKVDVFFRSKSPILSVSVPARESRKVSLPKDVVFKTEDELYYSDGVCVTSDTDVTLHVYNDVHHRSMDGFLVLPSQALGTEYFVMSYKPWIQSQVAIVALEDETHVHILPVIPFKYASTTVNAGTEIVIYLGQLQVKELICPGCDITGFRIRATKPISVISGNRCAFVPDDSIHSCDTLVEQLPPVSKWGKEFPVVPVPGRSPNITNYYKVVAARLGTEVSIGAQNVQLGPGQFYEFEITNNISTLVAANKPILLAQFTSGYDADNMTGDPAMTIIPAFEQSVKSVALTTYDFTNDNTAMTNYITIVSKCDAFVNITFDDQIVSEVLFNEPQRILLSDHCFASMEILPGIHHLEGDFVNDFDSDQDGFVAIQYGFAEYNSYSFPVALRLPDTLCVTSSSAGGYKKEHNCDEKVHFVELPYTGPTPTGEGQKCDYSNCVSPMTTIMIAIGCAILSVFIEVFIRIRCWSSNFHRDYPTQEDIEEKQTKRRVTVWQQHTVPPDMQSLDVHAQ